jgi:thiol-disulfide isomerase/thioredoxin
VPDTLVPEVERVIEMTREDEDVYQFVLSFLFNHFLKSNIMGMDEVYAFIGEKYYLGGQAPWADSTFLAKLEERIRKIKPNLIGNQAPDLKMLSNMGGYVSLHEVDAKITVLAFWEPNCGHCSKVIPKLETIYEDYADKGLEVYAVYTQNKKEEWVEFINEHALTFINVYDPYYTSNFRNLYDIYSTPTIYLLDEEKNILAKRIAVDDLKKFLKHELE